MADLSEIFLCLSHLERETADFYVSLSGRVRDEKVRALLLFIGMDSSKHSNLFKDLSGLESAEAEGCEELLGEMFSECVSLLRELEEKVRGKQEVEEEILPEIIRKLVEYEDKLGEEYLWKYMLRS